MTPSQRLIEALERQQQILNEMARLCALIKQELKGETHVTL